MLELKAQDHSLRQIAATLGVGYGTVRARLFTSHKMLPHKNEESCLGSIRELVGSVNTGASNPSDEPELLACPSFARSRRRVPMKLPTSNMPTLGSLGISSLRAIRQRPKQAARGRFCVSLLRIPKPSAASRAQSQ